MKVLAWVVALAFVLWTVMFSPLTAPHVPFWWMMTGSAITLSLLATFLSPGWWRGMRWNFGQLALGVAIAVGLWCVFFVGDKVATWLFAFARSQVDAIYMMRQGWSPWLLSALMLVLIGPAEEIFWRGYVQRTLAARWGQSVGFLSATLLYALAHVGSCNFMLVMAALVAGFVWGGMYRFFPRCFPAIVVSHALWDAAVFIWFPI